LCFVILGCSGPHLLLESFPPSIARRDRKWIRFETVHLVTAIEIDIEIGIGIDVLSFRSIAQTSKHRHFSIPIPIPISTGFVVNSTRTCVSNERALSAWSFRSDHPTRASFALICSTFAAFAASFPV